MTHNTPTNDPVYVIATDNGIILPSCTDPIVDHKTGTTIIAYLKEINPNLEYELIEAQVEMVDVNELLQRLNDDDE